MAVTTNLLGRKTAVPISSTKVVVVLKLRFLALLGLCVAAPAQAGLFSDDTAREQIQLLEARVLKQEESFNQQTKSMLDLQGQIEVLNGDIRKLRGQNEESAHGLQEAEKRSKDFYVDLDTRLRHFESAEEKAIKIVSPTADPSDPNDPAISNRAIENAYALFKNGDYENAAKSLREFIGMHSDSVHIPNAKRWLGDALYKLNNYKAAMDVYQGLLESTPSFSGASDVLFSIAVCQRELKMVLTEKKTLNELIAKYPDSEAAAKAKKRLAEKK